MHIFVLLAIGGAIGFGLYALNRRQRAIFPPPHTLIIPPPTEIRGERFLKLDGAINLRDIGGYPTDSGQRVQWGKVYRSGALTTLTPAGWQQLQAHGLKVVCDLRGKEEVEASPEQLPEGIIYQHLPIEAITDSLRQLRTALFAPHHLSDMLAGIYTDLVVDLNPRTFNAVFTRLADPHQLPLLIHCTAGKDRTGVLVAVLLAWLGVPDSYIISDYTQSNHYYSYFYGYAKASLQKVRWLRLRADDLQPMLTAEAHVIEKTLTHIRNRYGSIESYLKNAAGLDDDTLTRVRANLLA